MKPGVGVVCVLQKAVEPSIDWHCEDDVQGEPTPVAGAPPPVPPPPVGLPPPVGEPPPVAEPVHTPFVHAVKPLRTQF